MLFKEYPLSVEGSNKPMDFKEDVRTMEGIIKNGINATVRVDFPHRPRYMSRMCYLSERAQTFKELCQTHQSVVLNGSFYHKEVVKLYELLGYELPEHLVDMKDIPTVNGHFFHTIVFNPKMNGDSAK